MGGAEVKIQKWESWNLGSKGWWDELALGSWVSPPLLETQTSVLIQPTPRHPPPPSSLNFLYAPNDCKSLPLSSCFQHSKTALSPHLSSMAFSSSSLSPFPSISSIDQPTRPSTTRSTVTPFPLYDSLTSFFFFLFSFFLFFFLAFWFDFIYFCVDLWFQAETERNWADPCDQFGFFEVSWYLVFNCLSFFLSFFLFPPCVLSSFYVGRQMVA